MKESKKRRQKQPGKLMARFCSQLVNLPGARPLMNPCQWCFSGIIKPNDETNNREQVHKTD